MPVQEQAGPYGQKRGRWRPGGRLALVATTGALAVLAAVLVVPTIAGISGRTTAQGVRPVNAPPSFSPEVAGPPGWAPVDYGLLRLYLPPGWAAVSLCTPTASTSEASGEFVNVGGASYQVSTNKFLLRPGADQPTSCVLPRSGGWAVVGPLAGGAPTGWRPSTVNGTRVWAPVQEAPGHEALAVPSLRMELTAAGTGREVLATLGLSSLAVLLGAGGTLPVPASWKAVRFDGLQASVPANWPVEVVTREDAIPGVCNEPVFSSPVVYLGNGGSVPSCGLDFGTQLAPPVDGLWVFSGPSMPQEALSKPLGFGALRPVLHYSDTATDASATLQLHYANMEVVVGLGKDAVTAEEVIGSLQLTDLANSASTPTTTPAAGTPTTQVCPAGCAPHGKTQGSGFTLPTTTG